MKKAVQQIMLGTVTKNEKQTAETLRRIKAAGYDGIELNGFIGMQFQIILFNLCGFYDFLSAVL